MYTPPATVKTAISVPSPPPAAAIVVVLTEVADAVELLPLDVKEFITLTFPLELLLLSVGSSFSADLLMALAWTWKISSSCRPSPCSGSSAPLPCQILSRSSRRWLGMLGGAVGSALGPGTR